MSRDVSAAERSLPPSPLMIVRAHGRDAVSFQSLETGLHWWHDSDDRGTVRASVVYADTGRSCLLSLALRSVATIGPVLGTTALAWAAYLSRDARHRTLSRRLC